MHDDEEIRFFLDGRGFFDVRDQRNGADRWLRMSCLSGDLVVLPVRFSPRDVIVACAALIERVQTVQKAGIYHRFVVDPDLPRFHVLRLFCGDPVWTPHNRAKAETGVMCARWLCGRRCQCGV